MEKILLFGVSLIKKIYGERMKRRKNDSLKEKFESLMIKTMLIYFQKMLLDL